MNKIKKPENALKWINKALKSKDVVMGFGHRVYKRGDSRVPTMEKYFKKVASIKKDKKFITIYANLSQIISDLTSWFSTTSSIARFTPGA